MGKINKSQYIFSATGKKERVSTGTQRAPEGGRTYEWGTFTKGVNSTKSVSPCA